MMLDLQVERASADRPIIQVDEENGRTRNLDGALLLVPLEGQSGGSPSNRSAAPNQSGVGADVESSFVRLHPG